MPYKNDSGGIILKRVEDNCLFHYGISISNIEFLTNDTIYVGGAHTSSIASWRITDFDAVIVSYQLLQHSSVNNWVYFTEINSDTSMISGRFQLTFFNEHGNPNSDDPTRSDTIYFKNGHFDAVWNEPE